MTDTGLHCCIYTDKKGNIMVLRQKEEGEASTNDLYEQLNVEKLQEGNSNIL